MSLCFSTHNGRCKQHATYALLARSDASRHEFLAHLWPDVFLLNLGVDGGQFGFWEDLTAHLNVSFFTDSIYGGNVAPSKRG
jgi:hypothetical protein